VNLHRHAQDKVEHVLRTAGVWTKGYRPWDLIVYDSRFYDRVMTQGALGLGESYVEGWWDCADLAQLFCKLLRARVDRGCAMNWIDLLAYLKARFANLQGKPRAAENVHRHYDRGNDLYRNMLGQWMLYSSADWENAGTLDEAGEGKFDFVCRKLNLRAGQTILDIGCGWGGFAKFAAQRRGVHVVGITLSTEQVSLAREMCSHLPVEILNQDYRDLTGSFDHVVSLGMFEHVGHRNYRRYMQIVRRCLRAGGNFYLNTIGADESGYRLNLWTDKYIFPGGVLPSMAQIGRAIDGLFVIEELRNWAEFYDRTLVAWFEKFHSNWNQLKNRYNEQFYRMWKYYLLSSAGAFRSGALQDWQIMLSCR